MGNNGGYMKRYDIDFMGADWMNPASMEIIEQEDGEWVKWEDVQAAINGLALRHTRFRTFLMPETQVVPGLVHQDAK